MTEDRFFAHAQDLLERFAARTREELQLRWEGWNVDLGQKEVHEVVGALLARQVSLATQIAGSPGIWNGHIAPIILRAMADVYITLAWVLREPKERARKFIHYGLGREKLQLEHRRAELADREATPEEVAYLDATERWIDAQRLNFLTDVNLGSWSGIATRDMAKEAGCLDFYNYVYTPFSACTHSMWHHLARYNLRQCANPLHQYHGTPIAADLAIDAHYVYLAAKYLQETFEVFDTAVSVSIDGQSSLDLLCEGLDVLADRNRCGEADSDDSASGSVEPAP